MNCLINIFFAIQELLKFFDRALRAGENVSTNKVELNSQLLQFVHFLNVGINIRIEDLKIELLGFN